MTQTSEKNGQNTTPPRRDHQKNRARLEVFTIIMEYRESRLFQWIKLHPEISIG